MIRNVHLYNTAVLSTPTREVTIMTPEVEEVIIDLYDTLKYVGGLGLSAPQIGSDYKIFILTSGHLSTCFINPVIKKKSKTKTTDIEGCLSFPRLGVMVPRYDSITIEARDTDLVLREHELEGLLARVFQHEYDHLHGVFMHQRAEKWNTKYIKSYLKQLVRGNFSETLPEPEYPFILKNNFVDMEKNTVQPESKLIT